MIENDCSQQPGSLKVPSSVSARRPASQLFLSLSCPASPTPTQNYQVGLKQSVQGQEKEFTADIEWKKANWYFLCKATAATANPLWSQKQPVSRYMMIQPPVTGH